MQQWVDISHAQGPHTQILQICHSGGAEHVKKALEPSPVKIRKQITVLAIAPLLSGKEMMKFMCLFLKNDIIDLLENKALCNTL